jgi:DNA-binding transcriptional LysR family regulator
MQTISSADDLTVFLAVARTGRLVQAARLLGVDHTTVGRRISALERQAGRRLFNRTSGGWELTEDGERLLGPAEAVDAGLASAQEAVSGAGAALTGTVRILATDGFGAFIVAPALRSLRAAHPELLVELVTETQHFGSSVRDFDVAVTLEQPSSTRVVHRKLTDYVLRLYATPDYLERHPPIERIEDLREHTLIWYVDRLLNVEPLRVLRELRPAAANIQSTNLVAHWQAAAAGAGIAPIPHYIAMRDPTLVNVLPGFEVRRTYWVSTLSEHARLARVAAVVNLLDTVVRERQADLLDSH